MIKVYTDRMCDYLMDHGCFPELYEDGIYYFRKTLKVKRVLDKYFIQFSIFSSFYW